MGRRPSPEVAQLKSDLRNYLDEALALPVGLVIHAYTARDYVLRIDKAGEERVNRLRRHRDPSRN